MLTLKFLARFRDFGLLVMRIGLGLSFVVHGSGKMFGGPAAWEKLGGNMANFGIGFAPTFWGFMGAFAEFGGGVLLVLGFLFRPAAALLLCTMIVATGKHFFAGEGFKEYAHAMELAFVFFGLLFVGPGRYSLDRE